MTVYAPSGGGGAPTFPITQTSPVPASMLATPDAGSHALFTVQDSAGPGSITGKQAITFNPSQNGGGNAYINAANQGVGGIPMTIGAAALTLSCTAGPNNIYLNGPRSTIGSQGGNGTTIHSNSGAPPNPAYTAAAGDLYFRTDTPGTANQRVYICTAAGNPGTWVGIL